MLFTLGIIADNYCLNFQKEVKYSMKCKLLATTIYDLSNSHGQNIVFGYLESSQKNS